MASRGRCFGALVGGEELGDVPAECGPGLSGEFGGGAGVAGGADVDELVVVFDGVAAADQRGELAVEDAVDLRVDLFDDAAEDRVVRGRDGGGVEAVVGGEGGRGVVAVDGAFEGAVGFAHVPQVLLGHDRHGGLDGELVEGAQDGEGLLDVAAGEGGDAGVDARFGSDEGGGGWGGGGGGGGGGLSALRGVGGGCGGCGPRFGFGRAVCGGPGLLPPHHH